MGDIQSEVTAALVNGKGDAMPEELLQFENDQERSIAARLLPVIAEKANRQAEANKAKELEKFVGELQTENKRVLDAKLEEFRKAMVPPTPEELQKVLDQEYLEFSLKLKDRNGSKDFVIRELPMAAEAKVVKMLQKTLSSRLKDLSSVEWSAELSMVERIARLMEMVPGALETLSDCLAICLDPWDEQHVTGEWVQQNVSSSRMANILNAQIEVSRLRDFLSLASRFSRNSTTIN